MGGRGIIEQTLSKVFQDNILPQRDRWITYRRIDSKRTQRALLRYTLNHLWHLIDDDQESSFPEEAYIRPPQGDNPRTGYIVRKRSVNTSADGSNSPLYMVLNPACDLVIRTNTGTCKTDRILLGEIDSLTEVNLLALSGIESPSKKKKKLGEVFKNNYTDYYHWLPPTDYFDGGFLNFRKITTCLPQSFAAEFEPSGIQVSPFFVKDIVARFSTYYARQGQPDIDYNNLIEQLIS